jgi:PIN domain nuclease of toxin-antitoxin system
VRLLLDSHIFLALLERDREKLRPRLYAALRSSESILFLSVVSLWEISLKARLGKLLLDANPDRLPEVAADMALLLLSMTPEHAVWDLDPLPRTKDPFDRMLLAQCQAEDLRLVTLDRDLVDHPLAWRPPSA